MIYNATGTTSPVQTGHYGRLA